MHWKCNMTLKVVEGSSSLLLETTDGNVIHNLFHFLHIVFQGIKLPSKVVILEIEQSETGSHVGDEGRDVKGSLVVS